MAQTTVKGQLLKRLAREIAWWQSSGFRCGLYQEGSGLTINADIAKVIVATFTGYGGLQPWVSWSSPVWIAPRAKTVANPLQWICTGVQVANAIAGFYVVDGAGELAWFEPRSDGPKVIGTPGQTYMVTAVQTLRSEYQE